MSEPVTVAESDGVLSVVLSRPDKANALSDEMANGVIDAMDRARRDKVSAIVLKGEGRHFCAGFDFGDFEALSDGDLVLRFIRAEEMLQAVFHAPAPVLALVQGRAMGAGADLAAAAMKVVATPAARFQMPGPRFGVVLGTRRLAYRIGAVRARQIQIVNRPVDAEEGHSLGLIDALADQDDWADVEAEFVKAYRTLDLETARALAEVTRPDTRDVDMAALARSVAKPGIKERIAAFRAAAAKR